MKITTDGRYKLNPNTAASITTVLATGSLGGGVATLGYTSSDATFIPLVDGAIEVGGQYEVRHGSGVHVFLNLVGSSGAALEVIVGAIN
jgi:hypothetical protein